jgi:hypothetical protein
MLAEDTFHQDRRGDRRSDLGALPPGRGLGRFRDQNGKKAFAIEKGDVEGSLMRTLPRTSSRGRNRGKMGGRKAEVDLGGSGSLKSLMRPQIGVVEKDEMDPSFQLLAAERREESNSKEALRGSPESLDEGDGADFAEGSEAMANAEVAESLAEDVGRQLRALVGDEVFGRSEPLNRLLKQSGEIGAGRLARENTNGQRESGEHVKDDGEFEDEQAEERRDVGEIRHGDVVGIAGLEEPGAWFTYGRLGNRDRLFSANPSYGLGGELPAGAGEGLGDALVPAEA